MDASLHAWLTRQGGVVHSRTARDAGFSKHHVARAVASGSVRRARRSWLVAAECEPGLCKAAEVGGRLTCVDAAARLGLWVPRRSEVPHVSVPHSAAHHDATGVLLHWAQGPVPLERTDPHEHPLNMLFQVARCLPLKDALAVWESALRRRVVDADVIALVRWRSTRAEAIAKIAGSLSDSGLETAFVALMRRIGVAVRQQVWIDGHPVDGLIGERLVIQLDGFAHHQGRDRRRDLRADARLALRGYTVLRFDYQQVLFEPDYVIETVRAAIAQGLHLAR